MSLQSGPTLQLPSQVFDIHTVGTFYVDSIDNSLDDIATTLEQLNIAEKLPLGLFRTVLQGTSGDLAERWHSGRKVPRTKAIYEAIPNYPAQILPLSLMLDATINLLDDILDDIMTKAERSQRVLELLRVFARFNQLNIPPLFQQYVATYFNKCICIVLAENTFADNIKAASCLAQKIDFSMQCYNSKGLDMDIFTQLPLLELFGQDQRIEEITQLARMYRAVFLINKDLCDLEYDAEHQTETPLLLVSQSEPEQFSAYLQSLMAHYQIETDSWVPSYDDELAVTGRNLQALIYTEIAKHQASRAVMA